MDKDLEETTIFGGKDLMGAPGSAFAAERAACIRALQPAVRALIEQGHAPVVIVAALTALSGMIVDRPRQPPAGNANH